MTGKFQHTDGVQCLNVFIKTLFFFRESLFVLLLTQDLVKSPVHDLRCFSVGESLSENFEHPAGYVREFNPRSGSEVIREEAVEVVLDHRRRDDNLDLLKKGGITVSQVLQIKTDFCGKNRSKNFERVRVKSRNH